MVLKLVFFQYGSNVFLRGKLILAKGNDCAVIINDAPLQLLALPLGAPEVSPLSERAQIEQVSSQTQGEVPKEWTERMDQRQRIARLLRSISHDHAESVSVAHLHFGCEHQGHEATFGGTF